NFDFSDEKEPSPIEPALVLPSVSLSVLQSEKEAMWKYLRCSVLLFYVFYYNQRKADEQHNWRILENEKLVRLKERLRVMEIQLAKGRATVAKRSQELRARFELLDSARLMMAITTELLHKQSVVIKQVCRLFPQRRVSVEGDRRDGSIGCQYDQICNARLPRGLDPHSVPSEELAASLGYPISQHTYSVYMHMTFAIVLDVIFTYILVAQMF
ncbi:hypothetical protein EJ110_NYTH21797, partial [Nymphaea thermarum]